MKAWQIFGVGVAALLALLLLPTYERWIAGVCACALITTVIYGFILTPERDVFHVRTRIRVFDPDTNLVHERGLVAIRLEVCRLWLLFIPTLIAMAFLVVTAVFGTTWKFSVLGLILRDNGYWAVAIARFTVIVTLGIVSTWISERRVLRRAEAVSAKSASPSEGRVGYFFIDREGNYRGGETFTLGLIKPAALGRIVFYDLRNPECNKIAMSMLFHDLVIIGEGLTDLDYETTRSHSLAVETGNG